jgi:dTDP-4-dehydrorhamnose reductase
MRILVTGKSGQLGRSIQKIAYEENKFSQSNRHFVFVGREELDLTNGNNIAHYFENNVFDVIINCAAYTAVDKAEKEKDLANQVNCLAVRQLAQIAKKQKAKLIHISTDYVFDGVSKHSYKETDYTSPINVYGQTKLDGEKAIREIMPTDAIIIRTSWVYSEFGNNFVKTIIKLGREKDEISVVNDQIGSPTYATDLADAILAIIGSQEFRKNDQVMQIFHYSNEGELSWYEFAKEILKESKIDCEVNPIKTLEYPTPAKRPINTLLEKDKILEFFDIKIHNWKKSIQACIKYINYK